MTRNQSSGSRLPMDLTGMTDTGGSTELSADDFREDMRRGILAHREQNVGQKKRRIMVKEMQEAIESNEGQDLK